MTALGEFEEAMGRILLLATEDFWGGWRRHRQAQHENRRVRRPSSLFIRIISISE
jgi:hypothetical protein